MKPNHRIMSFPSNFDGDDELFEKHRGERRWLGKEHDRGKDKLYDSVKDRVLIQKTIESSEPLSKSAINTIANSTSDDLGLNVYYSMDKKNRWKNSNNVDLLKSVPSDVNAEVVERNIANEFCSTSDKHSTFSVHSKSITDSEDPSDFEIRSSTSSGPGQHYSNFSLQSRELSQKKLKNSETRYVKEPTVTYNIFKAHKSKDVVGAQMKEKKYRSKSGKNRGNFKTAVNKEANDSSEFEELEFSDEEQSPDDSERSINVDLSQLMVDSTRQKEKKRVYRKIVNFEESDSSKPDFDGRKIFNVQKYLNRVGYTFLEADIVFTNIPNMNFDREIEEIAKNIEVDVRYQSNQVLIDASKWSHSDANYDGETSLIIQISQMLKNTLQSIKDYSDVIKTTSYSEMVQDSSEWQNVLISLPHPDREMSKCSKDVMSIGVKQNWDRVCEIVREKHPIYATSSIPEVETVGNIVCSNCNTIHPIHDVFQINGGTIKCRDCLRKLFNANFEAYKVPIDLEIVDFSSSGLNTFDFLPTIIPLPILNFYTRKLFESIQQDLGANGVFDNCDNCKSTLIFEKESRSDRSCSCGYCWCSKCRVAPHWPMTCQQFTAWDDKWSQRYNYYKAQGDGNDTLMRIICTCKSAVLMLDYQPEM